MILVVVKDSTINILSFIYKTPQELPRVRMTQPLMQESPKHIMDATPQMSILLLFFTTEPGHSRTIQATVSKIIQDLIWRMKIQLVTSSNVLVRHSISRNSHSIIRSCRKRSSSLSAMNNLLQREMAVLMTSFLLAC